MLKNLKTTAMGSLMIASAAYQVATNPVKLTDPATIASVSGGVGLILAKDASNKREY